MKLRKWGKDSKSAWLRLFFLFNCVFFSAISFRYWSVSPASNGFISLSFAWIGTIGHSATIAFCGLFPCFVLSFFFGQLRLTTVLAVLLAGTTAVIMIADTFCYQQYRFHINGAMVQMFFGPASKEIFAFPQSMYAKSISLIAGIYVVEAMFAFILIRIGSKVSQRISRSLCYLVLVLAVTGAGSYPVADMLSITPITQAAEVLPYFPRITARRFLAKHGIESNTVRYAEPSGHGELKYPLDTLNCEKPAKPLNVLFVVVDAWRFDMQTQEVTPNVNAFSKGAINFLNHTSGGSATRSGIFSLFFGLPARYWHPVLAERRGPVLISKLKEYNYQFGIFASAPLSSPEFDRTVFVDLAPLTNTNKGQKPYERDLEIKDQFISFLENRDESRPFFGFLFFDAPHAFSIPSDFPLEFTPSLREPEFLALNPDYPPLPFLNLYKNTLRFEDGLIGEVLRELERRNLINNTVVVITGDHGQEFNEHGKNYWGHNGNFTKLQANIPLVLSWPGKQPANFSHWTSHVDVAPTILTELINCTNPAFSYSIGKSLFDTSGRRFLLLGNYDKMSIVEPNRITILNPYGSLQTTDANLNPLEGDLPSPEVFSEAMEQQRRFFATPN